MEHSIYFVQESLLVLANFIVPLFIILLFSGILISIIQAIFQIHEGSISYLSKLFITALYFFVMGRDFYTHLMTLIIKIFEGR